MEDTGLTFLFMAVNYAISWWNAYACGKVWVETKAIGGRFRLVVWAAAVMSAVGFSSVYTFLIGILAYRIGYLEAGHVNLLFSFWYVMTILPILMSGLVITIHSWQVFRREKSLANAGLANWNTYALLHNAAQAIKGIGDAFSSIGDAISGDDEKPNVGAIIFLLAFIGLLLGVLQTVYLIKRYAGTSPIPAAIKEAVDAKIDDAARRVRHYLEGLPPGTQRVTFKKVRKALNLNVHSSRRNLIQKKAVSGNSQWTCNINSFIRTFDDSARKLRQYLESLPLEIDKVSFTKACEALNLFVLPSRRKLVRKGILSGNSQWTYKGRSFVRTPD